MDIDGRLTGTQAARFLGVSKQLINHWRVSGLIAQGDDRRYRLGDLLLVERNTRLSPLSHRAKECA